MLAQHSGSIAQDSPARRPAKREPIPDTACGVILYYDLDGHPTRGTAAIAAAGGNPDDLMPVNERRLPAADSAPAAPDLDPNIDPPSQELDAHYRTRVTCRSRPELGPLTIRQAARLAGCHDTSIHSYFARGQRSPVGGLHFDRVPVAAQDPDDTVEEQD